MDTTLDTKCPNCHHRMGAHTLELGCEHGWQTECDEGHTHHHDGCECPLTLARQFGGPVTDAEDDA